MLRLAPLKSCLLCSLVTGYVNYDMYPMNYTSMANFFSSTPEEVDNLSLTLEAGHNVPSWLNADYLINGMGIFEWGDKSYKGWSDGSATASKLSIRDGGDLTFTKKFIKGNTYKTNKEQNTILFSEMATYAEPDDLVPPGTPKLKADQMRMDYYATHLTDNTVIKMHELYGHLVSFSEIESFNVLDKETLETLATININEAPNLPEFTVCNTQNAHGFIDLEREVFWNSAYCLITPGPHGPPKGAFMMLKFPNIFQKLEPTQILDLVEFGDPIVSDEKDQMANKTIPSMYMPYFHQAAITDDYFIMPFTSMELSSPTCIVEKLGDQDSFLDCLSINEDLVGVFVVLEKETMGEVARFRLDYYVSLHLINSYQVSKTEIHIDCEVLPIKGTNPFDRVLLETVNATGQVLVDNFNNTIIYSTPGRVVLDLTAPTGAYNLKPAKNTMFFDNAVDNHLWPGYMTAGADFPQVSATDYGKEYDVFYVNGLSGFYPDRIYRTQLSTLERKVWLEPGHACLETGVAVSPDGSQTVIISIATPMWLDEALRTSFVVFLDGDTLKELGRAYFPENVRVGASVHTTLLQYAVQDTTPADTTTGATSSATSVSPVETTIAQDTTPADTTTHEMTSSSATPVSPTETTTQSGSGLHFSISDLALMISFYFAL